MKPKFDTFWEDVELAKKGLFHVPESTRVKKIKQSENCLIVVNKMDEH